MTPDDFRHRLDAAFDGPNLTTRVQAAAWDLTRGERAVWRWLSGESPVPAIVEGKILAEWADPSP